MDQARRESDDETEAGEDGAGDEDAAREDGRVGAGAQDAAEAEGGEGDGGKGEEEGGHADGAQLLAAGQEVVGDIVDGGVAAEGEGGGGGEEEAEEEHEGAGAGAGDRGEGEEEDEDAEVLGVELHRVAAPVAVPLVGGLVEAAELRHDEGGDLLRVEGPAAGRGRAAPRACGRCRRGRRRAWTRS